MPGEAGSLIAGRYRLGEPAGPGNAGRVWRARDELLGREVAVWEVLLPPPGAGPQAQAERARLLDRVAGEARSAARLDHPGVVTVHDVIEDNGTPWIVMASAAGPTLGSETARLGRLPWPRVAALGQQLADALDHAHAAGLVHRDLTPESIVLAGPSADRAVITGFGTAGIADAVSALTGAGQQAGTLRYLAPEQLEDGPVGPPADLWALGAVLYTAVEGRPPFDASTQAATVAAILTKPVPPPAHAGPLADLLLSLLSKDPDARPDARSAARALIHPAATAAPTAETTPGPARAPLRSGATTPGRPSSQAADRPGGLGWPADASGRSRLVIGAITGIAMVAILILVVTLFAPGHARSPAALSGTLAGTLTDPSGYTARGVAFSPDAKTIAGFFGPSGQGAGHVDVWTSAGGRPTAVLAGPSGGDGPAGLAFSPASAAALAVGGGNGVSLWNLTARQARTYPAPGNSQVSGVAFAPDGATIAALGPGGAVDRLTVATGDWRTGQFTVSPDAARQGAAGPQVAGPGSAAAGSAAPGSAAQVSYSPDGTLLAVADGTGTVRVWPSSGGSPAVINGAAASPVAQPVAFSPDSKTLAVIASNGQVRLWNVASKTFTATLAGPGKSPRAVAFAPDGATLAVAGADGQVYLWDLSTTRPAAVATPLSASGGVTALAFSPDGKILAVAGDKSAKVYLYTVRYAGT